MMQTAEIELSDEEEYETIIYHGPGQPFETLEEPKGLSFKSIEPNLKLQPMSVKLAQASAQYGGLLSPDFFCVSPNTSSSSSSDNNRTYDNKMCALPPRDDTPSEVSGNSCSSAGIPTSSLNNQTRVPFAFPKVTNSSKNKSGYTVEPTDDILHKLERVEILDEDPENVDESKWIEWQKKYIEQNGFRLGVQPGNFYKNHGRPCFYVKLPHRSNYEVLVTNNNQVACDLDLYVNGQLTNALRLPAGVTRSIDGPAYAKNAFKIFRSKDAPPGKKVTKGARQNGVIKAVFTPEKIGSSRLRSVSEPLCTGLGPIDFLDFLKDPKEVRKQKSFTTNDQDKVERSLDMSQVVEGVTLLQGKKKKKHYAIASEIETDKSKRVVLQLRLIASLVEEIDATEEEIYDLEPPPLPSRRE